MAINKANRILGLIKKSFVNLDTNNLPPLYKSLVMPHLEYGNIIWGPHYKEDQKAIEKVQKRATKLMIQTYKIITEKFNLNKYLFFKILRSATRGHNYKLYKQHANKRLEWFRLQSS